MAAAKEVEAGKGADDPHKQCGGASSYLLNFASSLSPFTSNACSHAPQRVCGRGCGIYNKVKYGLKAPQSSPGRFQVFPGTRLLRSLHINPMKRLFHDLQKSKFRDPALEDAEKVQPLFCGFQLVGDSLLLRFAEQILQNDCIFEDGLRFLGFCVSGQTIDQLRMRLKIKFAPIGKRVILLIGTNDLLQNRDIKDMKTSFDMLVDVLAAFVDKLIILTLPPIPKLEDEREYSVKFQEFNTFLKLYPRKYDNIFIVDITNLFRFDETNSNLKYFERWYNESESKPDLVHLNYEGLVQMSEKLIKSRVLNALDQSTSVH